MLVYHIDVNSAYLSWTAASLLDKGYEKDIRNIPAVISGNPESRHGIILAKSIPAKKYGITTGESLFEARKKCPGLVVFPPDYDLYLSCSNFMCELLFEYTQQIQRYSIDECFCDMSAVKRAKEKPLEVAYEIKERVKKELGFTVNIGIGSNKLCAKMAGELKKPDMIHTLWMNEIPNKLWDLPVKKLFMVGNASEKKLEKIGVITIGQLAKADRNLLKASLKSHGLLIQDYANGIDNSPVTINDDIVQKGLSNGLTYSYDLEKIDEIKIELLALCERIGMRLRKMKCYTERVRVYLRSNNLFGYSHQVKLTEPICTTDEIYDIALELIFEMWRGEPVRAMSISLSELSKGEQLQLSLFDRRDKENLERLNFTVDEIREKFGAESIIRGSFANSDIKPIQGGVNDGDYIMMGGYKQ